jgi:hypothetical protein
MSVCWLIGSSILSVWFVALLHEQCQNWLLERELYPQPAQTSLADVRQLVKGGCRKEAILRYREKFPQVDLREAVFAVDSLR